MKGSLLHAFLSKKYGNYGRISVNRNIIKNKNTMDYYIQIQKYFNIFFTEPLIIYFLELLILSSLTFL